MNVKTLTDPDARYINYTHRTRTIHQLTSLAPPHLTNTTRRTKPTERRVYQLNRVELVASKLEQDGDIHLVVRDPGSARTMIVEFPSGLCTRLARPTPRGRIRRARAALIRQCGAPGRSSFRALTGVATIVGVAFFDRKHGQRGVARNAIEMHPVLTFHSTDCG